MPGCPYVCPFDQMCTPPVCQLKQFLRDVREGGSDRVGEDRQIKTRREGKWCLASSDSWFIPKSFFSPIFKIFPLSLRLFKCTETVVFTVNHIWGPPITAWTDTTQMCCYWRPNTVSLMSNDDAALEEIQTLSSVRKCSAKLHLTFESLAFRWIVRLIMLFFFAWYGKCFLMTKTLGATSQCLFLQNPSLLLRNSSWVVVEVKDCHI